MMMPPQVSTVVDEAFRYFRQEVISRMGDVLSDSTSESPDALVCTAPHQGAGLRLTWRMQTGLLELAISHGPPSGETAGWLGLYRTTLVQGTLLPDHGITFEDAVAYGLELLQPVHNV